METDCAENCESALPADIDEALPLLPDARAVCAEVRGVLRAVFRELHSLPPLAAPAPERPPTPTLEDQWDRRSCERLVVGERARRLARRGGGRASPPPPAAASPPCRAQPLLQRNDLRAEIQEDVTRGAVCEANTVSGASTPPAPPHTPFLPPLTRTISEQSFSVGYREPARMPPPPAASPAGAAAREPPPRLVVCVPPDFEFVNFVVGHTHKVDLRLVNVSASKVRVSLRPPAHAELSLTVRGRLAVTAGAALAVTVSFKPRDVRPFDDALHVRVAGGRDVVVPFSCYLRPPLLEVMVPNLSPLGAASGAGDSRVPGNQEAEVVELGSRLLGEVHSVRLLLACASEHVAFFVLTEDAWLACSLTEVTRDGCVSSGPFRVSPAGWRGGGAARGGAWCVAREAGLHACALRLLASTAVVRPLQLLADALHYRRGHVAVVAQQRDYDICGVDDGSCEHYVHLGTAFPGRPISATVQLINHSPVTYSYYWSVRAWGECACWPADGGGGSVGSDDLCEGARAQRDRELLGLPLPASAASSAAAAALLCVEPQRGQLPPRAALALHVLAPDAGPVLGTSRAVLMLVLTNIPEESFEPGSEPAVIATDSVLSDPIPGMQPWQRHVCEVVHSQLEVWWEVAPLRFALDPAAVRLPHSRRVASVPLPLRATQLCGADAATAYWRPPASAWTGAEPAAEAAEECGAAGAGPAVELAPAHSVPATLRLPLPCMPDEQPAIDVVTLSAEEEFSAHTTVWRRAATRHPRLAPARVWLGLHTPGTPVRHELTITNDTYQHIYWFADVFRWCGENPPKKICQEAPAPCRQCDEKLCTCALLRPTCGALAIADEQVLEYNVHAPLVDGVVATLVAARRTRADVSRRPAATGTEGRAALLAYRVLAPRLVMRVRPCRSQCSKGSRCAAQCWLDPGGAARRRGAALLRTRQLPVGSRSCYRLHITNLTPLDTVVQWQPMLDKEDDAVDVDFVPNKAFVAGHATVEMRVVVSARRVSARRLRVASAAVREARQPLYLLLDTAVSGVTVRVEIPLGEGEETTETIDLLCAERPTVGGTRPPASDEEIFAAEDAKRAVRQENVCKCKTKEVYVPPVRRPMKPVEGPDDPYFVEFVTSPPPMTRVCSCGAVCAPTLPLHASAPALQLCAVAVRGAAARYVTLRNPGQLRAEWRAVVRRWPREEPTTAARLGDPAAAWLGAGPAGAWVSARPARGELPPAGEQRLLVRAGGDCWGLYHDQLLIQVEHLEPLVIDVWVEIVGSPLELALQPPHPVPPPEPVSTCPKPTGVPTLWVSVSDTERVVRARNTSRSALAVQAYLFREPDKARCVFPFRLYLRFLDLPPRECPCRRTDERAGESDGSRSAATEVDTGVELFLAPDFGMQDDAYFKVEPECTEVAAGAAGEWRVTLADVARREPAAAAWEQLLMLRMLPLQPQGPEWYRPLPPPLCLLLRAAPREPRLQLASRALRIAVCALDLPPNNVLRVRKRIHAKNVSSGWVYCQARVDAPWSLVLNRIRQEMMPLTLPPYSSTEICVEICINTNEVCPRNALEAPEEGDEPPAPRYPPRRVFRNPLHFHDELCCFETVSLSLVLKFPQLTIEPETLDFGFVCTDDTRKSYFSVRHTARRSLALRVRWRGAADVWAVSPRKLNVAPGETARVYVQYTADRSSGAAPARLVLRVGSGWLAAAGRARAVRSRDGKWRGPPHDHTDDTTLRHPWAPASPPDASAPVRRQ